MGSVLQVGPAQAGATNQRWAPIVDGRITVGGRIRQGRVSSGRLDWHVDPTSGAASVALNCRVHFADGSAIELRNHAVVVHSADFEAGRVAISSCA